MTQENEEFSKAFKDCCPSQEAAHWAKKSCRKCYGRGILGKRHVFGGKKQAEVFLDTQTGDKIYLNAESTQDVHCSCTQKKFQKWLAEFRRFYLALKAQNEGEANETAAA